MGSPEFDQMPVAVRALVQYYASVYAWARRLPRLPRAHQHLHRPLLGGKTPSFRGRKQILRTRSWALKLLKQQRQHLEWPRPRAFSAKSCLFQLY